MEITQRFQGQGATLKVSDTYCRRFKIGASLSSNCTKENNINFYPEISQFVREKFKKGIQLFGVGGCQPFLLVSNSIFGECAVEKK